RSARHFDTVRARFDFLSIKRLITSSKRSWVWRGKLAESAFSRNKTSVRGENMQKARAQTGTTLPSIHSHLDALTTRLRKPPPAERLGRLHARRSRRTRRRRHRGAAPAAAARRDRHVDLVPHSRRSAAAFPLHHCGDRRDSGGGAALHSGGSRPV